MDERLQKIAKNIEKMKIGPDETFKFHCTQCGKCCINREDILLNPFDLFRASKELRMRPRDFVEKYCDTYLGDSSCIPIVRLRSRGMIKRCPLLKNQKCSIHNAKPAVCAMFPIGRVVRVDAEKRDKMTVLPDQIEYIFTNPGCGDGTETYTVREWLEAFGIPFENEFFAKWANVSLCLGTIIRQCIDHFSENTANKLIELAYIKLYLNYDTDKEF